MSKRTETAKRIHSAGALSVRYWLVTALLGLAMLLALVPAAHAQAAPVQQIAQAPVTDNGPAQPIDVVVLLDDSGSMATCWPWPQDRPPFAPPCGAPSFNPPSDPAELRYSAARLLLQLADEQDRVAVVRFDSQAEGVGELGTLQTVGDLQNRRRLVESLQPPDNYFPRGYTRIDLGLDQALSILAGAREPGRSQYVLLLTDGEPSEPGNVPDQQPRIIEQLQQFTNDGVLLFPVVLCNEAAGCAGDFLREQAAGYGVREATTAQDLLRVFSEIFSAMKPDRSVITNRNADGALAMTAREAHGVRQIAFVTPRSDLLSVRRGGEPFLARNDLNDQNIDVNVLEGSALAGEWTAQTNDFSGFMVVQADSYPQLLSPPPSLADSPASVRYYPAGRPPLLIARSLGPGANEPLLYNNQVTLQPFGQGDTSALQLTEEPGEIRLQLGNDTEPLQLVRSFRLEPRADIPRLEIFSPLPSDPGLLEDGRVRLQVGFGAGSTATQLGATVYITDESDDAAGGGALVYQKRMECTNRLCTDTGFTPGDGRSYKIIYTLEGQQDNLRFGDWGETELELAPAVYLRGLPAQIDLAQMPPDGWPVSVTSGTIEEIGALYATMELQRLTDAEAGEDGAADAAEDIRSVTLDFVQEVPEEGSVDALFKVDGLETLRPGEYSGVIRLEARSPAGRPMDVNLRPGNELPVTFSVPRPLAAVEAQNIDFGATLFDTSPNFRLDQESLLPVRFVGQPFPVRVTLEDSSCPDLSIVVGDVQERAGGVFLPLRLRSSDPVQPATCRGTLALAGPDGDYDVTPARLNWQTRIDEVEWSVVNSDIDWGDLQDAGRRVEATVLVRFNGKTPFVLQAQGVQATGSGDNSRLQLAADELEVPPVEVSGPAEEDGVYAVPLTLVARQAIPFDQWRGTYYTGKLDLQILGLEDDVQTLTFTFRSPSFIQRYIAPVVVPVYSMPWALCAWPLTLFLLLVLVARMRGRGFDEEELEVAATNAALQTPVETPLEPATAAKQGQAAGAGDFVPVNPAQLDQVWGRSEWGTPWSGGEAGSNGDAQAANGAGSDPWRSGW